MKSREKFRIVWSVDPFAKPNRFQRSAVRAIEEIASQTPTEVLPIHVLAAGISERLRKLPATHLQKIKKRAQQKLTEIIGKRNVQARPLHILGHQFSSLKEGVSELLKFCSRLQADMIVVSTHAHAAPKRWIVGSFAETISNLSEIPVLVAPPAWKPAGGKKAVLFATDFSEESNAAFERLLALAAKQKWEVTIFSQIDYRFYPDFAFALAALGSYEDDLAKAMAFRQGQASKLVEKAKLAGVTTQVIVRATQSLGVADAIVKEIRKGYHFVALVSRSGLITNALLGGTTRQLIRKSPIPVWVIHFGKSKSAGARTHRRVKGIQSGVTSEKNATYLV